MCVCGGGVGAAMKRAGLDSTREVGDYHRLKEDIQHKERNVREYEKTEARTRVMTCNGLLPGRGGGRGRGYIH